MLSWSFWERTLWTVAQLALATLTIDSMDGVPITYAPFVAAAIAALKAYVAPHVGAPTAALGVPADKDTAPRIVEAGVPGPVARSARQGPSTSVQRLARVTLALRVSPVVLG
jgi:hypothetical protein